MTTNTAPAPQTMGSVAMRDAIRAASNADNTVYSAIVSLSLVLASTQVERVTAGDDIDAAKNKATFRAFLKLYAKRGNMVWRDTALLMDSVLSYRGKELDKAVSDYIDGGKNAGPCKKPEGARLVDGLARLKTYAFRLMEHALKNAGAEVIREIAGAKSAGCDADAQVEIWRRFVATDYGADYNALVSSLASDKPKAAKDPIDSIVEKAKEMGDADLQRLVMTLQGVWAERMAAASEVAEAFGETAEPAPATEAPATETAESIAA